MNEKKARQLRGKVGFVPSAKRKYIMGPPSGRLVTPPNDKPHRVAITGTICATGNSPRAMYQQAKRAAK